MGKDKKPQDYSEFERAILGGLYESYVTRKSECFLVGKGQGKYFSVHLYTVYGYDAFSKKGNKKLFTEILQIMSEKGKQNASKLIAYSVYRGGASLLLKAYDRPCCEAFVRYAVKNFADRYNKGLRNVGSPIRDDFDVKELTTSQEVFGVVQTIHGMVPYAAGNNEYPYNSFRYLMRGECDAAVILRLEGGIVSKDDFAQAIYGNSFSSTPSDKGHESLKSVLADIRKNETGYVACFPEKKLDFVLGEVSARTGRPYGAIAKMFYLHKRYDVMLSTLCDFIMRRECTYFDAISSLQLPDTMKLRIEVLAEINRVKHYGYGYIMGNVFGIFDEGYTMLCELFIALHERYDYTFEQLAVRFHLHDENIFEIRSKCGF